MLEHSYQGKWKPWTKERIPPHLQEPENDLQRNKKDKQEHIQELNVKHAVQKIQKKLIALEQPEQVHTENWNTVDLNFSSLLSSLLFLFLKKIGSEKSKMIEVWKKQTQPVSKAPANPSIPAPQRNNTLLSSHLQLFGK